MNWGLNVAVRLFRFSEQISLFQASFYLLNGEHVQFLHLNVALFINEN